MKNCCLCHKTLPLTAFGNDKHSKDKFTTACKLCRNARTRQWAKDNPDKTRRSRDGTKGYRKDYYANPEKNRHFKNLELKRAFGISIDDYNKMLAEQNGVCAICRTVQQSSRYKYYSVDHSHTTGKIRGLLCYLCNGAIGMLQDDPFILRNAADYIERGAL